MEQLKVTESKTVAVGQKMDLVFHTLQLGFFYMDFDLISKSIDKAKRGKQCHEIPNNILCFCLYESWPA